jgi:alkylhydroperoxidase family enzyme
VVTKSPPVAWYRTMAHNPEVAAAFATYWEMLHRGGTVPHEIKELARIQIAQMVGCEFCARQVFAAGTFDYGRRKDELRAAQLGAPGPQDPRGSALRPHAHPRRWPRRRCVRGTPKVLHQRRNYRDVRILLFYRRRQPHGQKLEYRAARRSLGDSRRRHVDSRRLSVEIELRIVAGRSASCATFGLVADLLTTSRAL